jgi:hypothetical protein
MVAAYEKWGDDFARSEIAEAWASDDVSRLSLAEIMSVPDARLMELGFGSWDGELTLIPLWAYPLIADGEILTSISGNRKTKGQDEIDLDVRAGCIAWGFIRPSDGSEATNTGNSGMNK